MNHKNNPWAFGHKIGFILFVAALFVGCQSLQRVDRSDTEYVESMRASETELVWVHHPAGIQCEETYYNNITEAVDDMRSHDIEVFDSFKFSVMVATVCGNLSSDRYATQIRWVDLDRARREGWQFLKDESVIKNNTPVY